MTTTPSEQATREAAASLAGVETTARSVADAAAEPATGITGAQSLVNALEHAGAGRRDVALGWRCMLVLTNARRYDVLGRWRERLRFRCRGLADAVADGDANGDEAGAQAGEHGPGDAPSWVRHWVSPNARATAVRAS